MKKWQIICPLAVIVTAAVAFAVISGSHHHRYFISAQTRMIGLELVSTTNSLRLVRLGPGLQKRLSEFLSSSSNVGEVLLGDESSPIGDGTACSRLILSNVTGERLGIRLRQDSQPERFHVLGYWTISEQDGPAPDSRR